MEKELLKKQINKMLKENGWTKCYGSYGIGLVMGKKQMEKGTAVISFGYIEDDRYDAEATFQRFVSSEEFKALGLEWAREEKKDNGWTVLYVRLSY